MVKSYRISKDCFSSACKQHMEEFRRRATGHALFDHPISLLSTQPVSIVLERRIQTLHFPTFESTRAAFLDRSFGRSFPGSRIILYYMIMTLYAMILYDSGMTCSGMT